MTFLESKQALARKLDIDYSDIANNALFSDADLTEWIQSGVTDAWDFKPWPFTQGTETATLDSNPKADYVDHPQDLMNESIYLLKVAGKEYRKLLMEDYLKWLEDFPTAADRIWSEYETFIFINKNSYSINDTFDLYGKKMAPKPSADGDLLPFSPITDNQEHSGNQAIILLAQAWALESEKKNKPDVAVGIRKQALGILKSLWTPYAQSKSYLQSKGRPMFELPDMFGENTMTGRQNNPASIGNFTYLN